MEVCGKTNEAEEEEIIKEEKRAIKQEEQTVKKEVGTMKEGQENKEEVLEETIKPSCESCQREDISTKASGICQECEEYMCSTCFRYHIKAKQCSNHIFIKGISTITLKSIVESPEKCKKHCNDTVKFYCTEHEAVGCGDCIILGHRMCKVEYIKDLSKDFEESEELSSLNTKAEQLKSKVKETVEKIKNNRKRCKENQEEVLREIRKFRTDFNTYLDKAEADIISEGNRLILDNEKLLEKLELDCKELSYNIDDVKEKLNTHSNVLFIHFVGCKKKVSELEVTAEHIRSSNKIGKVQFIPDKELCNIVTSTRKLGSWNVITSRTEEANFTRKKRGKYSTEEDILQNVTINWELLKNRFERTYYDRLDGCNFK